MQKNKSGQYISFHAVSASDGSDVTSGSPSVYYTIDNGTQSSGSGSITHKGSGEWSYSLAQSETNGDHIAYTFVLGTAISQTINVYPVAFDPTDVADLGVTALTGHTPQTGDSFARLGAPAGASVSADIAAVDGVVDSILDDTGTSGVVLANGSVTASAIATDAIDADSLASDAVAEIADAVWDELKSGHNVAGSFGKAVRQIQEGIISNESTVNDASATTTSFVTALTETTDDYYNQKVITFIDGNLSGQSRVISDYNGTTKTITVDEAFTEAPANGDGFIVLAFHQHTITEIKTEVRSEMDSNSTQLAAIVDDTGTSGVLISSGTGAGQLSISSGIVDANMEQIDTSATAAANLALSTGVIIPGAAVTGTLSTTQMSTDLTESTDDHYNGCLLIFTSGNLLGQRLSVTDYNGTSKVLTFSAATESPADGDDFILV